MQPTFPVRRFPWAYYAVPAALCALATGAALLVYGSLPEAIATHFDMRGIPNGWMNKGSYVILMSGQMWGLLALFLALDRFLVYPGLPSPLMSSIAGGMELLLLVIHLGIIGFYDMEGLSPFIVMGGCAGLFAGYIVVHSYLARASAAGVDSPPLWVDRPPHSWLDTVLFFARPILPSEIGAHEEGLVVRSWLYALAMPWDQIKSISHATAWEACAGIATRIASKPSRAVKLSLEGVKFPLVFSVSDEPRLIEEWKKRTGTAG